MNSAAVRRVPSGRLRNPRLWLLVAGGIIIALAAGAAVTGRFGPWARWGLVEFCSTR